MGTKTFEEIAITTAATIVAAEEGRSVLRAETELPNSLHHGVVCDGCDMFPIVGRRFRASGEDYDLCGACMETWKVGPQVGTKMFEEVCLPAPVRSAPVPCEELSYDIDNSEHQSVRPADELLQGLTEMECRKALAALMQNSQRDVRIAVNAAIAAAKKFVQPDSCKVEPFVPPPREVLNYDVFPTDQSQTPPTEELEDNSISESVVLANDQTAIEQTENEEVCVNSALEVNSKMSARILDSVDLVLGVEAYEDATVRGDVTSGRFADVMASYGATQAYHVGRIVITVADDDAALKVPACAQITIINNGEVPWPETSAIAIVDGPDYDFPHMQLSALQVGETAEVVMDLTVPASTLNPTQSVWAIIDAATNTMLGPIVCFEVAHE